MAKLKTYNEIVGSSPIHTPTPTTTVSKPTFQQPTINPSPTPSSGGFLSGLSSSPIFRPGKWVLEKANQALNSDLGQLAGYALTAPSRFFTGGLKEAQKNYVAGGGDLSKYSLIPGNSLSTTGKYLSDFWKGGKKQALKPWETGLHSGWSGGFHSAEPGSYNKFREEITGKELNPLEKASLFSAELAFPTTAELGIGKALNKIPGLSALKEQVLKPINAIPDILRKNKSVARAVEFFKPGFRNPTVYNIIQDAQRIGDVRVKELQEGITKLADVLTGDEQRIVSRMIEGKPFNDILKQIDNTVEQNKLRAISNVMTKIADEIGEEGVRLWRETGGEVGLNPQSFENLKGKYLPHIFDKYIKEGKLDSLINEMGVVGSNWKKRTGVAGFMEEFAPASFFGLGRQLKDIEYSKAWLQLKKLYKTDDVEKAIQKGFGYLPEDVKNLGVGKILGETPLPQEVIEMITQRQRGVHKDAVVRGMVNVLNAWKAGKTIYNPAYHIRNLISNQILANMATGGSLAQTVTDWFKAIYEYGGRGDQSYMDFARKSGLLKRKTFGQMFDDLLIDAGKLDRPGINKVKKFANFWKNAQQWSEETAKLNVFKAVVDDLAIKYKLTPEAVMRDKKLLKQAVDAAEEAIFSPYKLGEGERALMNLAIPFYTFTRQAVPFTVKTAVKHPDRLAKYPRFKEAAEGLSDEVVPDEGRTDYQKSAIQLPIEYEDQPVYLDPQYLYPFGNFTESGSLGLPFGLSANPLVSEIYEQAANKDLYFDSEIAKSELPGVELDDVFSSQPMRSGSQRAQHSLNTLAPTAAYRTPFGKVIPALKGEVDYQGRKRSVVMALLDAIGFKTAVFDPANKAKFDSWDKQTKIKEIQREMNGLYRDQRFIQNRTPEEQKETLEAYQQELYKAMQE